MTTEEGLRSDLIIHPSTEKFPDHVEHYLREEIGHGTIMGPFDSPPIQLHTSLFMTREKSDSDNRRAIVDLSWPKGKGVNDFVCQDRYVDLDFALTLPNIDHIVKGVKNLEKILSLPKLISLGCSNIFLWIIRIFAI